MRVGADYTDLATRPTRRPGRHTASGRGRTSGQSSLGGAHVVPDKGDAPVMPRASVVLVTITPDPPSGVKPWNLGSLQCRKAMEMSHWCF